MAFFSRALRSPLFWGTAATAGVLASPYSPFVSFNAAATLDGQSRGRRFQHSKGNRWDGDPLKLGPAPFPSLDPKEWRDFQLVESIPYNHDTRMYKFRVPEQPPEMPVSSFVLARAEIDGKEVIRPYTPIHQAPGELNLLVKMYPRGNMSVHLASLRVGDTLQLKGALPKLKYEANMKQKIGMVAGGTGITPMLQVIDKIVKDPEDNTEISLVLCNKSPRDVLLKHEIDELAARYPSKLKVTYVVDNPYLDWRGRVGLVNAQLLRETLPAPASDPLVYVCGPPGFMEAVSGNKAPDFSQGELKGALKDLGYQPNQVYKF